MQLQKEQVQNCSAYPILQAILPIMTELHLAVLEESEFEPFFTAIEGALSGKTIALFGSYGWGDGEWMRNWEERAKADGAVLVNDEGLIVNETPSDEDLETCKELGKQLIA